MQDLAERVAALASVGNDTLAPPPRSMRESQHEPGAKRLRLCMQGPAQTGLRAPQMTCGHEPDSAAAPPPPQQVVAETVMGQISDILAAGDGDDASSQAFAAKELFNFLVSTSEPRRWRKGDRVSKAKSPDSARMRRAQSRCRGRCTVPALRRT